MKQKQPIFNRKQGIGVLLFLAFVMIIRLFIYLLPSPTPPGCQNDSILVTKQNLQDTIILRQFDPNTADSLTLLQVGLKPWQIKNLLRYRAKGGHFRSNEDFRRLYGLTDSAFQVLHPYITIDTMPFFVQKRERLLRDSLRRDSLQQRYNARRDSIETAYMQRRDSLIKIGKLHIKKDTIIDINTADTNDLQYIRGIGKYTAIQIIRYRSLLGGYYTTQQLLEIQQIEYLNWDSVMPHLICDSSLIQPIQVNIASVEKLRHHPYISFTKAKAIYETRRRKIRLNGIEDLCPSVFTAEEASKIRPYIDFTPPAKPAHR